MTLMCTLCTLVQQHCTHICTHHFFLNFHKVFRSHILYLHTAVYLFNRNTFNLNMPLIQRNDRTTLVFHLDAISWAAAVIKFRTTNVLPLNPCMAHLNMFQPVSFLIQSVLCLLYHSLSLSLAFSLCLYHSLSCRVYVFSTALYFSHLSRTSQHEFPYKSTPHFNPFLQQPILLSSNHLFFIFPKLQCIQTDN